MVRSSSARSHLASLLDQRRDDRDFAGDPFARYRRAIAPCAVTWRGVPGCSAEPRAIGRDHHGRPESALSPQRQLARLGRMAELVDAGGTQFIIATHSPADIISLDDAPPRSVKLEDTSHYEITRGILEAPQRHWRLLRNEPGS
jgi:hypothetical protein